MLLLLLLRLLVLSTSTYTFIFSAFATFYIFPKNIITTPKNAYTKDLNNVDEMVPKYIDTLKKYNIDSISDVCASYKSLYSIIISFLQLLL